jgi:hypothetical protein
LGYFLFILLNATLFIRPSELVPALETLPIYLIIILLCLIFTFPQILKSVVNRPLADQPILVCVLGLFASGMLSHLTHFRFYETRVTAVDLFKPVMYFTLVTSSLDSSDRMRSFFKYLAIFAACNCILAVLQYYGYVNIEALSALQRRDVDAEEGEETFFLQLRSTGFFNDPNDLSLIIVVASVACFYFLDDRRTGLLRPAWLVPLGILLYSLALTRSRGGFLAFLGSVVTLLLFRFGRVRALALSAVILPALFLAFAGRSTDISTGDETAQSRIQLWAEGMALFRQNPVFGIGKGEYAEEVGHVAHNSFIHCYTELGLVGGTFFLSAFYLAFEAVRRLGPRPGPERDPEAARARPYLLAMIAGYSVGMWSLSRPYIEPTFMLLGLASAYYRIRDGARIRPELRFTSALVWKLAVISVVFLIFASTFIKIFIR